MTHTNGTHAASDETTCILVVDDDASTRQLLASMLARDAYRVVQAENGEEGLAAAYAQRPDLILSDIQMPRVNGIELTRRLRTDVSMATVPIILVSGLHETTDKIAGLDAGATDFVTKPFDRAVPPAGIGPVDPGRAGQRGRGQGPQHAAPLWADGLTRPGLGKVRWPWSRRP